MKIDREWEEAEVGMTGNLIAIFVGLATFTTGHDISAVLRGCGDDGTVDSETGREFGVSFNPNVSRSSLVRVEDLASGAGGGPAGGDGAIADGGGEGVVAALGVPGGLEASESMLAKGVEASPRTESRTLTQTSRRSCRGAAAPAAAEVRDAGVKAEDGEAEEAADADEL